MAKNSKEKGNWCSILPLLNMEAGAIFGNVITS